MKKILLGIVTALSVATFQNAQAQEAGGTGFYAGVYGGYAWAEAENSAGADPDPAGFDYGLYGGYKIDSMLDDAGIGLTGALEIFLGGSTADDSTGGVDIEKGREYGISFRPGFNWENSSISPYAILGYRNTEFEASSGGISTDETYHGFELGLGTELIQWDQINLRVEYSHVWYNEEDNINPSEDNLRLGLGYNF